MNAAIFSLLPVRRGTTIVSVRIGRWLSDLLGVPLLDNGDISSLGALDVLFIVNGSTLYCKHLEALAQAVRAARQVVWVQNDYTLPPPKAASDALSPFRRAFADRALVPHYWTTCEDNAAATEKSAWVNWNSLGFLMNAAGAALDSDSVLYYGAYRPGRASSFQAMYDAFAGGSLIISSTSENFPEKNRVPPFREDLLKSISEYGMGVYIQDEKTSKGRHSPATRFYEMLSVRLPMCFTPDCASTLLRYGYDVAPYVFHGKEDAQALLRDRRNVSLCQQKDWAEDFESRVASQVRSLYAQLDC